MKALIALCAGSLVLGGCFQVTVSEQQFLLPDQRVNANNIATVAPGYRFREITIPGSDGTPLYAQLLQRDNARATVLYFGGNNFRVKQLGRPVVAGYGTFPVNIVLVDHRGYGDSEGEPTLAWLWKDGVAVFDAVQRELPQQPIIVHGFSLGSFIAGHVASQRPAAGLILEGSATTADEWIDASTPWFAKPFVEVNIEPALQHINNADHVARLVVPVLVVVGENDRSAPPVLARRLYAAAGQSRYRDYLEVPELDHNSALDRPLFQQRFQQFLAQVLNPAGPASTAGAQP